MNYKVDWFIPQQILALTHYTPEISTEDFLAIMEATQACLQEINQPFHIIIDNRIIRSTQVVSLEEILHSIPQLQSLPLGWIIMVLPHAVQEKSASRESQKTGSAQLGFADTIEDAFHLLRVLDGNLHWEDQISDFFAEDNE